MKNPPIEFDGHGHGLSPDRSRHGLPYVVDVVEGLDLSALERAYAGKGSAAYHPATLLSLLIYGYATGTFSSRKIERATYDSLVFRYITCNRHPDHDTLATFRKRFGAEFQTAFIRVLQIARENQLSRFGTVSLDGTKIHANASRHSALSYAHAEKIEAQLKAHTTRLASRICPLRALRHFSSSCRSKSSKSTLMRFFSMSCSRNSQSVLASGTRFSGLSPRNRQKL